MTPSTWPSSADPAPDLKPQQPSRPPGSEGCGCCEGLSPQTPQALFNRMGLSAVQYRIGEHAQFRASLHAALSDARYAPLAALRTRDDADFTIGLIDAFACAADVLTFYQERIANESYLRTATERVSLQEMGKLIGYRLRPGVAAETLLAFALDTPPKPPATLVPEPGNFVTGVPASLTLAAGLKVQSVPGPDEKPQTFETLEGLNARPEWNAMRALPDEDRPPLFGARETWVQGTATQLKPGDALLFVGPQFDADVNSNRWDLRVLSEVQADDAQGRTRLAWAQPLGSVAPFKQTADPPRLYALRDRAAIFGASAVDWHALSDDFKRSYLGLPAGSALSAAQRAQWPQFDIYAPDGADGLRVTAHVTAQEAAAVLRETVHAATLSMARESATAAGALGGAAGGLVQRIVALPAHVGNAALNVSSKLPQAVGEITQQLMAPLRDLVDLATHTLARSEADTRSQLASMTSGINNALNTAGNHLGVTVPNLPSPPAPPAPAPSPAPAATPSILLSGGVQAINTALSDAQQAATGFSSTLDGEFKGVMNDTRGLWAAQGHLLESAIAGSAATTALARLEVALALQPRVPFADVDSVCDAVDQARAEVDERVPAFIVAAALSDPRVAALTLGLLSESSFDPVDALAEASRGLAERLAAVLQHSADPMQVAVSAQAVLAPLLNSPGEQANVLLLAPLQRLHRAATQGVQRLSAALAVQSAALREGRLARVFAGRSAQAVGLDREYTGIVAGSYAVLSKPDYVELYRVDAVTQGSRAEFALSGKSTALRLSGQNLSMFATAVRETTVFARSENLARARAPITQDISGERIAVAASVAGLLPGRPVLVKGERSDGGGPLVHAARLVSATPAALAADGGELRIAPALPHALKRGSTVVYGNVAPASHGETVAQVLGAGDATRRFQRFELKQLPLTHRSAESERGAAAELTVRMGDIAWQLRPTLYGTGPSERVYTLSTDEQGREFVVFGDGVRGARLPSGSNNVRASYRKGLGTAGNVRAETLTQLMTRPLGLKSVANLLPAEGGTDPESADAARLSMPLGTRTLGRAVSLLDYEDFARAYSGIAKAQAQVLNLRGGKTIAITLAAPSGLPLTPASPVWTHLLAALKASGDPHVAVQLLSLQASTFHVGLRVKCDLAYEAAQVLSAVQAALRAAFSFDARALGQPVQQSEVIAVAQAVPGVLALDLTHLYGGSAPAPQTVHQGTPNVRLLAQRMNATGGVAQPAELLTLDPGPFDLLEALP